MSIGVIFKITDLLALGASWQPIVTIFLSSMPTALAFAIPISALVASLLVFGRLSSDHEITAMKACGISQWQIISSTLLVSIVLASICLYINNEIAPRSHYKRRQATAKLVIESPVDILEEGRYIHDFNGMTIYVGKKSGDQLRNIRICDTTQDNSRRQIHAKTGSISINTNQTDIVINLFAVRIDPFTRNRPGAGFCDTLSITLPDTLKRNSYRPTRKDMTIFDLWHNITNITTAFPDIYGKESKRLRMVFMVELNKRLALSLSCISFVLLGAPLGIRSRRRESSIGIAISLALAFGFYIFILIAESLAVHYLMRPDLIVLFPVFVFTGLGTFLIRRVN
ncbi:MAG: LptF/LptG family permease, partial [Kiritimatiellae bacterium]|nr:LptF/LptG family permease [Kiritimatiellia bacterium]